MGYWLAAVAAMHNYVPSSSRGWDDPHLEHLAALNLQRREHQVLEHPENNQVNRVLFEDPERWARKVYCSDNKMASRIRPLASAVEKYQYLQANPPWGCARMVFDVDRAGESAFSWEQANLPEPSWSTVNRATGNCHLVYELKAPVLLHSATHAVRPKPVRLLSIIEANFRQRLQADRGYGGLITRNPVHPKWRVLRSGMLYELQHLGDYVPDAFKLPAKGSLEAAAVNLLGLQRNVELFDALRAWAYVAIGTVDGGYGQWVRDVMYAADDLNGRFKHPLGTEVSYVARSVAKWVWDNRRAASAAFTALQASRGKRGGIASGKVRREGSADAGAKAAALASSGMTHRDIGRLLGVDHSTVTRWLKRLGA